MSGFNHVNLIVNIVDDLADITDQIPKGIENNDKPLYVVMQFNSEGQSFGKFSAIANKIRAPENADIGAIYEFIWYMGSIDDYLLILITLTGGKWIMKIL